MHTTIFAAFLEFSRTVSSMCGAGILLFVVALWAAKTDIAQARGLDKVFAGVILALANADATHGLKCRLPTSHEASFETWSTTVGS
jgi:hypothetical protein